MHSCLQSIQSGAAAHCCKETHTASVTCPAQQAPALCCTAMSFFCMPHCLADICLFLPVQDTINILRGISEKYSSYHGVRIADRALVVAAELADRYITNRFLPDKAIDLVDEACSNMRVQLDSMPEEMDKMQRQQYRLQVEEAALAKETDLASYRL